MFFAHRSNGPVDECLQYHVVDPAVPAWYFTSCKPDFPIGRGSVICLNYSDEAIQKAVLQFSTMIREKGDNVTAVGHDDVGLSQESYEAPSYEINDNVEDLYDFHERHSPPNDIDVPEDSNHEDDDDSIS